MKQMSRMSDVQNQSDISKYYKQSRKELVPKKIGSVNSSVNYSNIQDDGGGFDAAEEPLFSYNDPQLLAQPDVPREKEKKIAFPVQSKQFHQSKPFMRSSSKSVQKQHQSSDLYGGPQQKRLQNMKSNFAQIQNQNQNEYSQQYYSQIEQRQRNDNQIYQSQQLAPIHNKSMADLPSYNSEQNISQGFEVERQSAAVAAAIAGNNSYDLILENFQNQPLGKFNIEKSSNRNLSGPNMFTQINQNKILNSGRAKTNVRTHSMSMAKSNRQSIGNSINPYDNSNKQNVGNLSMQELPPQTAREGREQVFVPSNRFQGGRQGRYLVSKSGSNSQMIRNKHSNQNSENSLNLQLLNPSTSSGQNQTSLPKHIQINSKIVNIKINQQNSKLKNIEQNRYGSVVEQRAESKNGKLVSGSLRNSAQNESLKQRFNSQVRGGGENQKKKSQKNQQFLNKIKNKMVSIEDTVKMIQQKSSKNNQN